MDLRSSGTASELSMTRLLLLQNRTSINVMSQQPAQTTQTAIPAQILQSFDEFLAQLDTVERSGKAFFDKV